MTGDGKQQEARCECLPDWLAHGQHQHGCKLARQASQPSHASGEPGQELAAYNATMGLDEPTLTYTIDQLRLMLDTRCQQEFQRGQQAMAEKAAQPLLKLANDMRSDAQVLNDPRPFFSYATRLEAIARSLAGAEPPQHKPDEFDFMSRKVVIALIETARTLDKMDEPGRSVGITALEECYFRICGKQFDWEEFKIAEAATREPGAREGV